MKKIELVCKKCGSNNFYVSLSERMNTIFKIMNGVVTEKDIAYPDDGEINYMECSKCGAEIDGFYGDEIISSIQKYL